MINYGLLSESTIYYQSKGFTRIEVPWTVSKPICDITRPTDKSSYELKHNNKVLVGSGEQSFLYLYLKGFLPYGKYQAITPCFRDEQFDFCHSKYFMKNELIITNSVNNNTLNQLVDIAFDFFYDHINEKSKLQLHSVKTNEGYDILYKGYEIGSYGIRQCEFLTWIYGTALAEPRFSNVCNLRKDVYKDEVK